MPHLSVLERMRVVDLFNKLPNTTKKKFEVVASLALKTYHIKICGKRVQNIVAKYHAVLPTSRGQTRRKS